jgi:putative ABC transport system permease protein
MGLVMGMSVERRRNEISMLLSRGSTRAQIVGAAAIEGLLAGLAALAIGLLAGRWVAQMATRTRTFLDFTALGESQFQLTPQVLWAGFSAVALGLVAQVLPTARAAGYTVVAYKQDLARSLRPPRWQRAGVDLLLLALSAYGTFTLRRRDGGGTLAAGNLALGDPFQDPLLFVVPFLTFFAATLFAARVLPLSVSLLAWLASQSRSVGFVLATRHLSRTPRFYAAPMILLVMTLGLSSFISSTALSLDTHLLHQIRHRAGAELIVYPEIGAGEASTPGTDPGQPPDSIKMPEWSYVPLSDYLGLAGVRQAARVQRYWASPSGDIASRGGTLMGVDRSRFAQVSFWRADYASESLGSLMNALALSDRGVLAPQGFLDEHGLAVGDSLRLEVMTYGQENEFVFEIVQAFDLFPTWHPDWGPLFVGNLDHLFEQLGTELPASVWLDIDPAADLERVKAELATLNPDSFIQQPLYREIAVEQGRPERQGLFGVFSVGFIAAAVLAALGFLLYAIFSLQRRTIELCTLQSMGLSFGQMSGYIGWEHAFLMLVGLGIGTLLGIAVSRWWIPLYRAGTDAWARVVPVYVSIGWPAMRGVYALFGLLLVAVLALAVIASRRVRVSEAIKLMETA